jgi:hypothetical protein
MNVFAYNRRDVQLAGHTYERDRDRCRDSDWRAIRGILARGQRLDVELSDKREDVVGSPRATNVKFEWMRRKYGKLYEVVSVRIN